MRGFFSDRFGHEATDFTVLVGSPGALEVSIYEEVTGRPPPRRWTYGGHVLTSRDGTTIAIFGYYPGRLDWNTISHEYIHVMQRHLAGWGGFRSEGVDLGPQRRVRVSRYTPRWQLEGLAVYGDYLYQVTWPNRDQPFIPFTLAPYRYVYCNPDGWADPGLELRDGVGEYELYFLASIFLLEYLPESAGRYLDGSAWLTYWQLLDEVENYWLSERIGPSEYRMTFIVDWEPAFEQAFGISADDFYAAFGEWAKSDVIAERMYTGISYGDTKDDRGC